ncbi:hypothetical protein S245_017700 [Arachis hypogaea]
MWKWVRNQFQLIVMLLEIKTVGVEREEVALRIQTRRVFVYKATFVPFCQNHAEDRVLVLTIISSLC